MICCNETADVVAVKTSHDDRPDSHQTFIIDSGIDSDAGFDAVTSNGDAMSDRFILIDN
jgi:hypothetical protein